MAIVLALAKYLREEKVVPARKVYAHVTVYEEIGHGGCGTVPDGVTQLLAVDMGCVGEGLTCTERQVSICAKSSAGPSDYEMTTDLSRAAKAAGAVGRWTSIPITAPMPTPLSGRDGMCVMV